MRGSFFIALLLASQPFVSSQTFASDRPKLTSMKDLQMKDLERQTLDYSCGAAALAVLLKRYFGDTWEEKDLLADIVLRLSKEELQDRMLQGFSMLDLKKAAERLGYSADGVLLSPESVGALKGPVIILLRRKALNHFVVLKGVSQGRAFLADPTRGHVRLPLYELFQEWHGETLIVGREGFGLPSQHDLAPPKGHAVAPERETARALRFTPVD